MRLAERIRRIRARTDVRAASTIAGLLLLAMVVQGLALEAFVADESLGEADRWMGHALRVIALRAERGEPLEPAFADLRDSLPHEAVALRVRGADGSVALSLGSWPAPERQLPTRRGGRGPAMLGTWLFGREPRLVGDTALRDGRRLELALPLAHFASESLEMARGIALVGLVSVVAALLTGLAAGLRAFAPLRRATALLREVDAGSLGARLPTRGTGDPVDLHAETLNRVLARIDASFARLRTFSSDAAHELRTPLNRIHNVAEVALRGGDDREVRAALETIRRTTDELSQMVQSLLLLAEIGDRRLAPPWPTLDADTWIETSVETYAPSFEERGVELAARSAVGTLEGDRTLLDRILVNLLDNALAHVGAGGRVEVSARRAGAGVEICVDDSGPGIPAVERERVFERFARLEPGDPGHGLGLAIARAVARLHGGELDLLDSPLGGSRFRVVLPGRRAAAVAGGPIA